MRTALFPSLLAVLVLGGAACGSDSDRAATVTTSSAASPDTTPAEPAPAETSPPGTTLPAGTTPVDTAPVDDDRVALTRAVFAGIAADDPGCTVAVGLGGEVMYAEAFGSANLDTGLPMTTDTVVDIASTSKQFTATAIALLAERGVVDVDATLATYVPDLPEWAQTTTITQLVHHTSGIKDYIGLLFEDGIIDTEPSDDADALRVLAAADELNFAPGTSWEYSNSNYFLLGQVVLNVTGDDLGAFLAVEVFTPLGMDAVMDPTAKIIGKATSYRIAGDEWTLADSPWTQLGDGGIQTTPTQLINWASQYWAPTIGDADINTVRLADAATVVDSRSDVPERYGYGIMEATLDGRQVLTHDGAWGGFNTGFVVDPAQELVVAFTCTALESVPASSLGDPAADIIRIWS